MHTAVMVHIHNACAMCMQGHVDVYQYLASISLAATTVTNNKGKIAMELLKVQLHPAIGTSRYVHCTSGSLSHALF